MSLRACVCVCILIYTHSAVLYLADISSCRWLRSQVGTGLASTTNTLNDNEANQRRRARRRLRLPRLLFGVLATQDVVSFVASSGPAGKQWNRYERATTNPTILLGRPDDIPLNKNWVTFLLVVVLRMRISSCCGTEQQPEEPRRVGRGASFRRL